MKAAKLDWRVVLVRPRNPLNIGAAARAMANFGLREMLIVAPHEPVWREVRSAVGAEQVLRSARAVPTLLDAVSDTSLVVGTTAGSRRNLDRPLLPLPELPDWVRKRRTRGRAAILFGSEKTGLSNQDFSYCHALVRIPTRPDCPSMNLGQAVAVCAYELAGSASVSLRGLPVTIHQSDPANLHALEHLFARAARLLECVGFLKPKTRHATLIKLRRLLLGLELTNHDVRILGGVLAQIEWKLGTESKLR